MIAGLRLARPEDREAIEALVAAAYAPYVARIGMKPAPMEDDYAARIAAGQARVMEDGEGLLAVMVLVQEPAAMLLDDIAIAARGRGRGLATRLIGVAVTEAWAAGLARIRLYTDAKMIENQSIYAHLDFVETHRAERLGRQAVFMEKALDG